MIAHPPRTGTGFPNALSPVEFALDKPAELNRTKIWHANNSEAEASRHRSKVAHPA